MSKNKLLTLAEDFGFESVEEMLEAYITDSVAPGICKNDWCDYSCECEPDCTEGWCEICETNSVVSCFVLEGII